ncbi:MAG: hypothetical protein ACE5LU_06045 [Anaerolineae bacterium]
MQSNLGQRTAEFMDRLQRNRGALPDILVRLSNVLAGRIEEIEQPQAEDITLLLQRLAFQVGPREFLRAACGQAGEWCKLCPFGAFIPPEFDFSSETQAVCLPWIAVVGYDVR